MNETWKTIPGYHYSVSNLGKIKNNKTNRILKPYYFNKYVIVRLSNNGLIKDFLIHRLVAQEFIPNPQNKKYVNHKNFITNNNEVDNLEWCTQLENVRYNLFNGHRSRGEFKKGKDHPSAKLTENQVMEIRKLYNNNNLSQYNLASIYKVSRSTIEDIVHKRKWAWL